MRYIVLVSGFSKSGKDTFSDFLVKHNFIKYAFADELKLQVSQKYNFNYNLTQTQQGKNTQIINNKTVRDLLIKEASAFRLKNSNYYAIKLVEKINFIDKIQDYRGTIYNNIVISDWRYINEYTFIQKAFKCKIITVRINRHEESPVNSETEHYLDDFKFDYTIENTLSIEDFYKNIINKLYVLFD
jgi:dephospho-CoA kinase